jgi:hypothetical protein
MGLDAQLRCLKHVVRMGDGRYPKMAWQAGTQGSCPKEDPDMLRWDIEDFEGKMN